MTCPVCGEETKVVESAKDCETVYRKRRCVSCKHTFYTEESEVTSGNSLKRIRYMNRYKKHE